MQRFGKNYHRALYDQNYLATQHHKIVRIPAVIENVIFSGLTGDYPVGYHGSEWGRFEIVVKYRDTSGKSHRDRISLETDFGVTSGELAETIFGEKHTSKLPVDGQGNVRLAGQKLDALTLDGKLVGVLAVLSTDDNKSRS